MEAKKVYFRLTGIRAFLFQIIFTVNAIYFIVEAGLNPLQLVLIGTIMELSIVLFEVPTGVIADHVSRKKSVIIGTILLGLAHLLEGSVPAFWGIATAYAVWGLGYTFLSGAEEAWIADEVEGKGLDKLFLKGSQIASIGKIAGIMASMVISMLFSVQAAIQIAGGSFIILAVWLWFRMPEHRFEKLEREETSQLRQLAGAVQKGYRTVKGNPVLAGMAGIALMWGLASEGFDRLWAAHFLEDIQLAESSAVLWFGLINGIALLLNIGLVEWISRRLNGDGEPTYVRLLLFVNVALAASTLIFALSGELWLALASYWTSFTLRGLNSPLYSIWLNQKLESKGRATMLSLFGQIDAIGQIAGGPLVGWIAFSFSISAGLFATGLFTVPVLIFLWIAGRYANSRVSESSGQEDTG
ncbi:MFS transporter [Bacillus infantis]|uniref:MFS transporter n=1 Tax=Bacillus infantis TaxID=324767 RepID=UPI001CD22B8A|nr:MFS transporter [Bacillus infantis]MCA1041872.1 MFS transporter [Bacillus infantis]